MESRSEKSIAESTAASSDKEESKQPAVLTAQQVLEKYEYGGIDMSDLNKKFEEFQNGK